MTLARLLKRFAALDVLDAEVARVNDGIREHGSAAAYLDARLSRPGVRQPRKSRRRSPGAQQHKEGELREE